MEVEMNIVVGRDGNEYDLDSGKYKLQKNGIIGGWVGLKGRYQFITKVVDDALIEQDTSISSDNVTQFHLQRAKKQQLSEAYAMKGLSRLSSGNALEAWADIAHTRAEQAQRKDMIGVKSTEIVGKMTGLMPDRRILSDEMGNDVGVRIDISKDVLADALSVIQELRDDSLVDSDYTVIDDIHISE